MEAIVYTTKGGSTMDAIKNIIIRLETKEDYRAVENLTRESFWNVYRPGCMEHYVLHCYRNDPAFVSELDFVMELGGELIGQVIYVRSEIECDDGRTLPIMTFGPIGIAPAYKRQGYGKIAERRNEQHERCRGRKTLGLMSVVRCQDALADIAGNGISNFSFVLSQMQA